MRAISAAVVALLSACAPTFDPCPPDSDPLRSEDRCVRFIADAAMTDEDPLEEGDAGADAGVDDMDGSQRLDAATDAGQDGDASAHDGGDASSPLCSGADLRAWSDFHREPGLVDSLVACAPLGCADDGCPAATCIATRAEVTACSDCIAAEGSCVLEFCGSACGPHGTDAECRACACETGCAERFETCAGARIPACENAYGRESSAEERAFHRPIAYRQKSGFGLLVSSPLRAYPDEATSSVLVSSSSDTEGLYRRRGSRGFTHLVGMMLDGRPYMLEHKVSCLEEPCIARISPVLRDGSFGYATYVAAWTRGWDEIESFHVGEHTFLLRYKTGRVQPTDERQGSLRIDRVTQREGSEELQLETVLEERGGPGQAPPWSSIEAFAHAGATYLLFYGSDRDGAVELKRVEATATTFALRIASSPLAWSRGWDIVETFPLAGRAHVLLYKSGRFTMTGEPEGSVRILGFNATTDQRISFTTALYQSTWPPRITNVIGYADGAQSYLLRVDSVAGMAALIRLNEPAQLATLGTVLALPSWSATPPYDVIEVVRQQPW